MKSIYNIFNKHGQLIALGLGLLCILVAFAGIFGGLGSAGFDTSTDLNAVLKEGGGDGFNFFNGAITIPVLLAILAVVVIAIFGVVGLITNPKGSITVIIAVGILLGLFLLLTQTSEVESSGKIANLMQKYDMSDGVSQRISGGIKTTVGLAILAFVGIVVMEIYNFFK